MRENQGGDNWRRDAEPGRVPQLLPGRSDRISPLAEALKGDDQSIWWDDQLPPGSRFRHVITEALQAATAVVVVWSETSVTKDFVNDEADEGNRRGVLVPARIDAVDPPLGFRQLHYANLVGWKGGDHPELAKLRNVVSRLVGGFANPGDRWWTDLPNSANWAQDAATRLHQLTVDMHTAVRLVKDAPAGMAKLGAALGEVHATYKAVLDAIDLFRSGSETALDHDHFAELARGRLIMEVAEKRGHCTAISFAYWESEGIRASLASPTPAELEHLDKVFATLGTADGDVFQGMTDMAVSLAGESSALANLLLAGQTDAARARFDEDDGVLRRLEAAFNAQMAAVLRFAGELGITFD